MIGRGAPRSGRSACTVGLAVLAWQSACFLSVDISGAPCPCVDGYRCEESTNTCVRRSGVSDAGVDAGRDAAISAQSFQYVWDDILVAGNSTQAINVALDLDGDSDRDNALGGFIATLATTLSLDLRTPSRDQVCAGETIMLTSIRGIELGAEDLALTVTPGEDPIPDPIAPPSDAGPGGCGAHLMGDGQFTVVDGLPGGDLTGSGTDGVLDASGESAFVGLSFADGLQTAWILLRNVRMRGTPLASPMAISDGRFCGALHVVEVDNVLLPALHSGLSAIVDRDCQGGAPCCDVGSEGERIVAFFDENDNCRISFSEVLGNSLVEETINSPDLDLLDCGEPPGPDCVPGTDGGKDSLSLCVGFSATGGSFDQ